MGRTGQNPLKWIQNNENYQDITIITIVHIPDLSGFWENSFEALKTCLNSLKQNTDEKYDLMVWDNGSCREVKDYLFSCHANGEIKSLFFSSYNMRKLGALNQLLHIAPGNIISYSDSDVFFKKGWLKESLRIIKNYPEVGMVSGLPTIDKTENYFGSTYQGIENASDLLVETGNNLIPIEYINAHRKSIGKSKEEYFSSRNKRIDTKITRNNVSAYVCAQDFQFTSKKEIIDKVLPLEVRSEKEYYDPIYSPVFEAKLDELGFWRVSTEDYLIHHIGNNVDMLDYEILKINNNPKQRSKDAPITKIKSKNKIYKRFKLHPLTRKVLKYIYSKIYKILYEF